MLRLSIKDIIKKHSLSITKNRKKILKLFLDSDKPLSLKQIRSSVGLIDRVTLFRILSVFEEKKIIHIIRLESGDTLYAFCKEKCPIGKHEHNHIHFQCESCDTVSCVPINDYPNIQIPNYQLNNININVSGLCSSCML